MTTDGRVTPDAELTQLRQELELLRAERGQFLEQLQQKNRALESLQHQLQYLLRRLFGRSAEKIDPKQRLLFETLLNQLAPPTPAPQATGESAPAPRPETNGHGRRRLPSDLPRRKVIHDLPEAQKPCPCCGSLRHVIGQEISEQLEYVPARLTVIEHVRLKYACCACEANVSESGPQITTAVKPASPIEKGLAAPGLLAYVMVSKYSDHLPLHRLESILARHGIVIARSTMCDWAAQCALLLHPLYDRMIREVLGSKVIHTDDTPVKVLDRRLDRTRTGRFWVYVGDSSHPCTVFTYTPSRSRDGPQQFLKGWSGYLQADAFGGYDGIYAGQAGGRVTEVACWAHARRKFYDARNADAAAATTALAHIRLLYDVEDEAKKRFEPHARTGARCSSGESSASSAESSFLSEGSSASPGGSSVSSEESSAGPHTLSSIRHALRQEKSVPRLTPFRAWLEAQQASRGGPVLPRSPMGQAITYTLNQWDALCVYTTDGDLAIDNNVSENALRRVALGRKNWLFCGSDNGGNTAAVLFSLIATCQRHRVEPYEYLRDVLNRMTAEPRRPLENLLPDRWRASQTATTPVS